MRRHGTKALGARLGTAVLGGAGVEAGPTDRVQQYLGLAQATLERPITPAELEAAALSPADGEDIAAHRSTDGESGKAPGPALQ